MTLIIMKTLWICQKKKVKETSKEICKHRSEYTPTMDEKRIPKNELKEIAKIKKLFSDFSQHLIMFH